MKKIFRILLVFILLILTVLLVTPILFKKQILNKAKEIANTSVNAKIDFTDLKLTFFKDFPRLTTSLYGVSVSGIEVFEGDTLIAFDEFSATVDVISLVRKEAIKVRSILLDNPRISAIILEDGSANWDIAKESKDSESDVEPDDPGPGTMDLKVVLKKFEIRDASIAYLDRKSGMEASLDGFNFLLSGDLAQDFTSLELTSTTERLNLIMGGIRYVRDAMLNIMIILDADLVNSVFTLMDNSFAINDLVLLLDGKVTMHEGGDIGVDINFNTKETSFKSLLSMVPAVYMRDFENVQTDGELALSGSIRGNLTDDHTPSADIKLLVNNARFEYPELPKSAERIHIDVDVHYDGIQNDNSIVDVNGFHVELGDNPVDFTMHMVTPISDPKVNATLSAKIDFSTLADVVPMEDMSLTGTLDANIDLMGKMSSIENERYDEFKADGSLKLQQFEMQSPDIPQPVFINNAVMNFSPQYVNLVEFNANIGNSDVRMDGKLENFLPYLFEDGMIAGKLNLESNLLDLNEFMLDEAGEEEGEPAGEPAEEPSAGTTDTVAMSVIEIPGNIDFVFTSSLKKVLFNKLEIDNLSGLIIIRDQKVIMRNLSLQLLEGNVIMSGEYNTQDMKSPLVDLTLDVDKIDIPSAFNSLATVQKLAPIAERTSGTVSTNLDFTSFLGEGMKPVMNSIVAKGKLVSEQISIEKTETFDMINGILKTEKFKDITMKDLAIDYSVRNGRVYIEPYHTKIGNTELVMRGDQGIDQTMNYEMNMKIPRSDLGGTAQNAINQVTSLAASQGINIDPGETIDVKFLVTGTFKDPKIKPVFGEGLETMTEEVKEQVQEIIEEKVEEVKEEIKEDVTREAEKILAEAQAKADALKWEAKQAGEELIRLAEEEGQKRIKDAGNNLIQKIAAETYAKTLESEADKNVKMLEDEANKQADEIMRQAQEQVVRLK
ncbi:MAG: AsmA-like C-terminal region-containing protein [Bacteroidales bacterium]